MDIIWNILAIISILTVVAIIMVMSERKKKDSSIRRMYNCAHPSSYYVNQKKLCTRCGKEIPRLTEFH